MTYEELKEMTEGKTLPMEAITDDGELAIIESGENDGESYFKTTVLQDNDWLRIHHYWEDGTVEETYKK